jgi:hypothetical protein
MELSVMKNSSETMHCEGCFICNFKILFSGIALLEHNKIKLTAL